MLKEKAVRRRAHQELKTKVLKELETRIVHDVEHHWNTHDFLMTREGLAEFFEGAESDYRQMLRFWGFLLVAILEAGVLLIDQHQNLDHLIGYCTVVALVSLFKIVILKPEIEVEEQRLFTELKQQGFQVPYLHWPSLRVEYLDSVWNLSQERQSEVNDQMNLQLQQLRSVITVGDDGELIFPGDEVDEFSASKSQYRG